MPRPTRAQLRRLLQDWGLPQVDPDSYFIGVFPESISIAVDEIERLTAQDRGFVSSAHRQAPASATATTANADITPTPTANEIIVIRSLFVDLDTANIERVEVRLRGTSGDVLIWEEGVTGGPALPIGRLIGGPNIQTTSFGTFLPIVLDGRDAQSLRVRIAIGVAALIEATVGVAQYTFQRPFVGFGT